MIANSEYTGNIGPPMVEPPGGAPSGRCCSATRTMAATTEPCSVTQPHRSLTKPEHTCEHVERSSRVLRAHSLTHYFLHEGIVIREGAELWHVDMHPLAKPALGGLLGHLMQLPLLFRVSVSVSARLTNWYLCVCSPQLQGSQTKRGIIPYALLRQV